MSTNPIKCVRKMTINDNKNPLFALDVLLYPLNPSFSAQRSPFCTEFQTAMPAYDPTYLLLVSTSFSRVCILRDAAALLYSGSENVQLLGYFGWGCWRINRLRCFAESTEVMLNDLHKQHMFYIINIPFIFQLHVSTGRAYWCKAQF